MAERIIRVELHVSTGFNYPSGKKWERGAIINLIDESGSPVGFHNPDHPTDPPHIYREFEGQKDTAIMEARRLKVPFMMIDQDLIQKYKINYHLERKLKEMFSNLIVVPRKKK